ncbi:hypothetical protein PAXRUDRAFT_101717, partial [Paxillus rubicundulus Ve08.2h10]
AACVEEVPDEKDPFRDLEPRTPVPQRPTAEEVPDNEGPHAPPPIDPNEEELLNSIHENILLDDLHLSMAFITSLSSASLDGPHSGLNADTL